VSIVLDALGDEASAGFTVHQAAGPGGAPPVIFTNPVVELGSGVPPGALLSTNFAQAPGSVGIVISAPNTFAAGTREVARVTYNIPSNAPLGAYTIAFSSVPTDRVVYNSLGASLETDYLAGVVQVASRGLVTVSGRVLTPQGQGVRNAIVRLTDSNGVVRLATTSSFGLYAFEGVEIESSVVISVSLRRYRFAPRVIDSVTAMSNADFVALE
jgi:hypothetical protein